MICCINISFPVYSQLDSTHYVANSVKVGQDSILQHGKQHVNSLWSKFKLYIQSKSNSSSKELADQINSYSTLSELSIYSDTSESKPHLGFRDNFKNGIVAIGSGISYYPLIDSSYEINPYRKSFWINTSATIYNLPLSFSFITGEGISYSEVPNSLPFQSNLSFDYRQYLENVKESYINQYRTKQFAMLGQLQEFNIEDTVQYYELLKDTLANTQYQSLINQMQVRKEQMIDSAENCYEIDSIALDSVNKTLNAYYSIREKFNKMIALQSKYFELQSKYEAITSKIAKLDESLSNAGDLSGISAIAEEAGLKTDLPKWPSRFKSFEIGDQVIQHTPLTMQNYYSKGFSSEYGYNNKILMVTLLTQNAFTGISVLTENDSLFNPYQNNQSIYMVAYGIGNLDSNYSLVTNILSRERYFANNSTIKLNSLVFSINQHQNFNSNYFGEYELAYGTRLGTEIYDDLDTTKPQQLDNKLAVFGKFGVKLNQFNTVADIEGSIIGLAYINLKNPFVFPGTKNIGLGIQQQFYQGKLQISYKSILSSPVSSNPVKANTLYQMGQVQFAPNGKVQFNLLFSPYQYNYLITDVPESNSLIQGNLINGIICINTDFKKYPISTVITYSNFNSQSNVADTLIMLHVHTFNLYNNIKFTKTNINTEIAYNYFINEYDYYLPNSLSIAMDIIDWKSIQIVAGPKVLDHLNYNDQIGGRIGGQILITKLAIINFDVEKYFDLQQHKATAYSNIFFNASASITLN